MIYLFQPPYLYVGGGTKMLMVADARGRGILNADVSTFIPKLFLKSNTFNLMKLSSAFSQLQYLTISILICLCRNLKLLTQARGGIEMLMDADVGEGVSKISQKVLTQFMDDPYAHVFQPHAKSSNIIQGRRNLMCKDMHLSTQS